MTLILSKVPLETTKADQQISHVDTDVQHIFMKALYMVAEKQIRYIILTCLSGSAEFFFQIGQKCCMYFYCQLCICGNQIVALSLVIR